MMMLMLTLVMCCYPYIVRNDIIDEEDDNDDMCDDGGFDELEWDYIHEQAMVKLNEIKRIMRKAGVMENVEEHGVVRRKTDHYHDDHDHYHDDNIVVRCKHSYTGQFIIHHSISFKLFLKVCSPSWPYLC